MKRVAIGVAVTIAAGLLIAAGANQLIKVSSEDIRYYPGSYTRPSRTGGSAVTVHGVQPVNVNGWGVFGNNTAAEADSLARLLSVMDAAGGGDVYFPAPVTAYNITGCVVANAKTRLTGFVPPLIQGGAPRDIWGTGSPEGVYVAPVGSIYRSALGNTGDIYVKKIGALATGWVLVSGAGTPGTTGDVTPPTLSSVQGNIQCVTNVVHLSAYAATSERSRLILSYRVNSGSYSAPDMAASLAGGTISHSITLTSACSQANIYDLHVSAIDSVGNLSAVTTVSGLQLSGGTTYPVVIANSQSWLSLASSDSSVIVHSSATPSRNGVLNNDACNIFVQWKHNYNGTWTPTYTAATNDLTGWSTSSSTAPVMSRATSLPISTVNGDTFYVRAKLRLATGDTTPTAWSTLAGIKSNRPVAGAVFVDNVSGKAVQESLVTIVGTGFGTKATAAPIRALNFENLSDGANLPDQGSGGFHYDAGRVSISSAHARGGKTKSILQDVTAPAVAGAGIWLSGLNGKAYYSGWFYRVIGATPSRNVKWWEVCYNDLSTVSFQGRHDVYPSDGSGHLYIIGCGAQQLTGCDDEIGVPGFTAGDCNQYTGFSGNQFTNAWHRYEMWIDQGTVGNSDGRVAVWLDGVLQGGFSGPFAAQCPFNTLYLMHYYAVDTGSPAPWCQTWQDEVYVDNTLARVEIGNSNVFSQCSHREIITPVTWTGTQITAKFNTGSFSAGDPVYLFVVDANGMASAGWGPITIGNSSTPPPSGGAEITASGILTSYTCDGNGFTHPTVFANVSETGTWVVLQARSLGDLAWYPSYTSGDTTGTKAQHATGSSFTFSVPSPSLGVCEKSTGSTYEVRIAAIFSSDLARHSVPYVAENVTILDSPAVASSQTSYYRSTGPTAFNIRADITSATPGKIFTQIARSDTAAIVWRPKRSGTTGWTGLSTTPTQTRTLLRTVPDNSRWRVRAKIAGTMNDTTSWTALDSLTVAAVVSRSYLITANSTYQSVGGYHTVSDTTQLRTGWINLQDGPTPGTQATMCVNGTSPYRTLSVGVSQVARFGNNGIRIPIMYFGTDSLTSFSGATVDSAILYLWSAGTTNQTGGTPPDTLLFVGADKDSLTWGKFPQYGACRSYRSKLHTGGTIAWVDPDGAGAMTTDPYTWSDFTTITDLPIRTLATAGKGILGNRNLTWYPTPDMIRVDMTEFYQKLADGKQNGGIWPLSGNIGHVSQGASGYGFYSNTAESAYTGYRPVLKIVYHK